MDADKRQYIEKDLSDRDQVNDMPPIYNQQPIAGTTVQITPIANEPQAFRPVGPKSMEMTCPSCRCRIQTTVRHRSTAKTHIACLLLTFACCCCCLPYCMDSCRNANHFCPMCEAFLGTYSS